MRIDKTNGLLKLKKFKMHIIIKQVYEFYIIENYVNNMG